MERHAVRDDAFRRRLRKACGKHFVGTSLDMLTAAIKNYQTFDVWTTTPITNKQAFERIQDIMENAGELSQRVGYDVM